MICSNLMHYLHISVHGINITQILAGTVKRDMVCVVRKADAGWKTLWNVAYTTETSATPCFWYLWSKSVGNYESDRSASSSWGVTGCENCSFCKETVGMGLTLGPVNGHANQWQRTLVLHSAEQNLSVLSFTEHAMCFCNTEKKVQCIASFPHGLALLPAREVTISWSFTSRAHPSILVPTQDITWIGIKLSLHGFCFLPLLMNRSCKSIAAAAPSSLSPFALAAALLFLAGVLSTCPPLDLTSAAMWGFVCSNPGDRYRDTYGDRYRYRYRYVCACVCVYYFFLIVCKRQLCSFCARNGQR